MPKNTDTDLVHCVTPSPIGGEGRGVGVVTRVGAVAREGAMTLADGSTYHNIEHPHPTFPLNGEGFTKHIAHYDDEEDN